MRLILLPVIFSLWFSDGACQLGPQPDSVAILKHQLTSASSDSGRIKIYLRLARKWESTNLADAITAADKAVMLSRKLRDTSPLVQSLTMSGSIHFKNSQHKHAILDLREAIDLGMKSSAPKNTTEAYLLLSITYLRLPELDSARECVNAGLMLSKHNKDSRHEAAFQNVLGNILKEENNLNDALASYLRAANVCDSIRDKDCLTQSLSNIGNIQYLLGNYENAAGYAKKSLDIAVAIKKSSSIAYSHRLLGRIYRKQKHLDLALASYQRALEIYHASGEKRELSETYTSIGNIYNQKQNYLQAIDWYGKALRVNKTIPNLAGTAYDYNALAVAYYYIGKKNTALHFFDSAMHEAKRSRNALLVMDGHKALSEIYSELGRYQLALENYIRFTTIKDSLAVLSNKQATDELEARYQNEKKAEQIRTLESENKLNALQFASQSAQRKYLIGIVVLFGLLLIALYSRYNTKKKTHEKLQALDQAKTTFFTNISHEFRTPLSLIMGPLSHSIEKSSPIKTEEIALMYRNAGRLHSLINQLFDLARIESGSMKLEVRKDSLSDFLKMIFSSFETQAKQKSIVYSYAINAQVQSGYFDADKLEKILFNLIANALKFTPSGETIHIEATTKNDTLVITVKDTGPGIDAENLKHIFDRFYQADDLAIRSRDGAGIGLALSKELAEIHRGSLAVASVPGHGSLFTLSITITKDHYRNEIRDITTLSTANSPEQTLPGNDLGQLSKVDFEPVMSDNKPSVLLAEDNEDMQRFITQVLQSQFSIDHASDGLEAWEKIQNSVPDLVISDIMMPRMDGNELCKKIKTLTATSHIPVIMLTARADLDSKIEGLTTGADDYLAKPFDARELEIRIKNLVAQRDHLRRLYQQHITLEPQGIPLANPEAEFLQRVKDVLEERYSDPDFDVDAFSKSLGLSRMQMHRKLKAVTTMSTGDFLRKFRIERAKQFLQSQSDLHIGEIAYHCGFSNFSHFTKVFKEYSGQTPSAFIKEKIRE